jgi:hypothetical protein
MEADYVIQKKEIAFSFWVCEKKKPNIFGQENEREIIYQTYYNAAN